MEDEVYLALDPGKDKVGVVLGSKGERILYQGVWERKRVVELVGELMKEYPKVVLILGDGTASKALERDLMKGLSFQGPFVFVDESYSTQEGRSLYFKENPPRGWRRFWPLSLQNPPVLWDDYAARILLGRFLKKKIIKKKDSSGKY